MIYETQALILNTHKYGDTSIICSLFTKDYGKISIISKGARKIKNPNQAILQPLNFIDLNFYFKPQRNIQILKEASINKHFFNIKKSYQKFLYSFHIIDIINQICKVENPNHIIFRLSKKILKYINQNNEKLIPIYFIFFLLQLLKYLGYQPILNHCNICNQNLISGIYCFNTGQLICNNCNNQPSSIKINSIELQLLNNLYSTHIKKINIINIQCNMNSAQKYLISYLSFHLIDITKMKSLGLINK